MRYAICYPQMAKMVLILMTLVTLPLQKCLAMLSLRFAFEADFILYAKHLSFQRDYLLSTQRHRPPQQQEQCKSTNNTDNDVDSGQFLCALIVYRHPSTSFTKSLCKKNKNWGRWKENRIEKKTKKKKKKKINKLMSNMSEKNRMKPEQIRQISISTVYSEKNGQKVYYGHHRINVIGAFRCYSSLASLRFNAQPCYYSKLKWI